MKLPYVDFLNKMHFFYLQQTFNEGPFRPTCTKCLESMQTMAKDLNKLDKKDHDLQDRYDDHKARWDRLVTMMDGVCLELKQLPERWKDYNQRYITKKLVKLPFIN